MSIIELITLLFKKIGTKDDWNTLFKTLWKIPNMLKAFLISTLIIGSIYLCYSKVYTYEIEELKVELTNLNTKLLQLLYLPDYENDKFYLFESLIALEYMVQYMYNEELLSLKLLYKQFSRNHPNDPILVDIEEIIRRNNNIYKYYNLQFKRSLYNCDKTLYKQLTDSVPNFIEELDYK